MWVDFWKIRTLFLLLDISCAIPNQSNVGELVAG